MGPDEQERLARLIREDPDATLQQLKQRGGFTCTLKTLWCSLHEQGLTFKKKSLHASEQERPDVQKKRRSFRRKVKRIEPARLVFVDETGVTTAMTPAYAWSPRGTRAVDSAPGAWESVTVIAALGLDGVRATVAFPGATDAAAFQSYVEQVLVPALHEGDVVVFDNLKPHLASGVAEAIKRAGARAAPASVQPGLHADRGDVLEGQGVPPTNRGTNQGRPLRRHRGGARTSDSPRHHWLVPRGRPVQPMGKPL